MLLLVLLRAGAGDHTPSRICIHVGAEFEGVLGVNQTSLSQQLPARYMRDRFSKSKALTLPVRRTVNPHLVVSELGYSKIKKSF